MEGWGLEVGRGRGLGATLNRLNLQQAFGMCVGTTHRFTNIHTGMRAKKIGMITAKNTPTFLIKGV